MESTIKPPRIRRNTHQIHDLLKEFDEGNVSVALFCRKHSISNGTFYKWRSRYKRKTEKKIKGAGFAAVRIIPSLGPGLFAEVNGIKIYQPVAASYLKELLS